MHIIAQKNNILCSSCGSKNAFERFERFDGISGIRCLNCGHSKLDQEPVVNEEAKRKFEEAMVQLREIKREVRF